MIYILKFFNFSIIFLILTGCSVSTISLDIVRPAEIDVPSHIQNIVVINRSLPSNSNQLVNILDGVFSGEGIGDDKKGSEMCVSGLKTALNIKINGKSKFNILNGESFIDSEHLKGTGTDQWPEPLSWGKTKIEFQDFDIDGLIVLETFDSKSSIINNGLVEKIKLFNKKKQKVKLTEAILNMEVQAGWRIYDLKNQSIIDQKIFIDQKSFSETGLTFEAAKDKLPNKRYAISKTGLFAGEQYAFRVSPKYEIVKRYFYIKAKKSFKLENESFKRAYNLFKYDNFEKSAEIWKGFTNHADFQIAGRACFNMALVCELKNKYNLAVVWVNKSIAYNNKRAINYLSILEKRKKEIKKVEQQLKQ